MTSGSPAGSPAAKSIEQVCEKGVELLQRYSKLGNMSSLCQYNTVRSVPAASPRVHSARRRLGADLTAQLITDYQSGTPSTALMRKYQLGKGTVLQILNEAGVLRKRCHPTSEQVDEMVVLYQQGWSLVRIGKHCGFSHGSVWLWLKDRGIEMRKSWERAQ
jgi:hypothetical protein